VLNDGIDELEEIPDVEQRQPELIPMAVPDAVPTVNKKKIKVIKKVIPNQPQAEEEPVARPQQQQQDLDEIPMIASDEPEEVLENPRSF